MLNAIKFRIGQVRGLAQRFFNTKILRKPNPDFLDINPSRPRPPCPRPRRKPHFNVCDVQVEKARAEYEPLIRSFLYNEYFPREPSLLGLAIPQCSSKRSFYLEYLANHYIRESNGFVAFKYDHERKEKEMVGLLFGKKKYPWEAQFYEKWAEKSREPECIHMFFHAHCFRHPDFFRKYNVPFLYDIEVVSTATEHAGKGVAQTLLQAAIFYAIEMCYPVVQLIATNTFMINPCKRLGMKKEWTMHYREYVDYCGRPLFCLRHPHRTVNIFVRTPHYKDLYTPEFYRLFNHPNGELDYKLKPLKPPVPYCSALKMALPPPHKVC